jgi:hypothetical protein
MAPRQTDTPDVETPTTDESELEQTNATPAEGESTDKPKAAPKEPARGDLPEGYVTPVGFAKILGEKGLQKNREGEVLKVVAPQQVYSYIKNAPKDDAFPMETVKDSIGKERQAFKTEAGLEWWNRKNERVAAKSANAKAKAEKRAAAAAAKDATATEAEGDSSTSAEPAVEAE